MINFNKLMTANFLSLFLITAACADSSSSTDSPYFYPYPGSGYPLVIEMHNDTTKEIYFDMDMKSRAFHSTIVKFLDKSNIVNAYPYFMLPAGAKASFSINSGDDYGYFNGKCNDLRLFIIKDQFNLVSGSPGTITFGVHQTCIDDLNRIVPSVATIIDNDAALKKSSLKVTISPVDKTHSDYPNSIYDKFTLTITSNENHLTQ